MMVEEGKRVWATAVLYSSCALGPPGAFGRIRQKLLRRGESERGVSRVKGG
jgi:hypothetical protein